MIQRQAFSIAGAAVAAILALSASAQAAQRVQKVEKVEKPLASGERIAALQVRVLDRQTDKVRFVELGVPIQIAPGQELRLSLVGADRQDDNAGRAGDVGGQARVFEASNRGAIDLGNSGGNWVIVKGLEKRGSRAEVGYEVQGNYLMDRNLRTGRIPLELVYDDRPGGGSHGSDTGGDTDRRRRAEDLVSILYRGILQREGSRDSAFRADVDRVFRDGYDGVRQVARDLADDAERNGVFEHRRSSEVVGDLYRTLLGRTDSNQSLWDRDGGFRDNVRLMERSDGLRQVVDVVVGSVEFQRNHDLDSYGFMRPYRR